MPHIIVEHTSKTADQMPALCAALFTAASALDTFPDASAIKVRSVLCANHTGGAGDDILHVTMRMLEGRTADEKSHVSTALMNTVTTQFPQVANITCEIVDMHRTSYQKRKI